MKQVFPKEILEFTADVHRFRHRKKSLVIYAVLLLFLSSSILALPFISIPLYISSHGVIKPEKERIQLRVIQAGQISFSALMNNKTVQKGDTLVRLNHRALKLRQNVLKNEIGTHRRMVNDLETLVLNDETDPEHLTSDLYQVEATRYQQQLQAFKIQIQKHRRIAARSLKLLQKGVVAQAEFEALQHAYGKARIELKQFKRQQQNTWQHELARNQAALLEQQQEAAELQETLAQYVLLAPVTGSLLNTTPLEKGSFISAGAIVAELSPDTTLIAECYVSPSKVGLIRKQTAVRFHIDAFDHNQWGQANGEILEVSRDVEFVQDQPVFRIRCTIREEYLALQNGRKGYLRKGLTLTAHIKMTERSLFDLLDDQWQNWLNPHMSK